MNTKSKIKAAESLLKKIDKQRDEVNALLNDLYVQRSTELYGIKPGMRVQSRDGLFIVDRIRPEEDGEKPWLYGRLIKKDGTPGSMERTIYGSWEIV